MRGGPSAVAGGCWTPGRGQGLSGLLLRGSDRGRSDIESLLGPAGPHTDVKQVVSLFSAGFVKC